MKSVLALLLLAVLQSIAAVPTAPQFDADKEYVYHYRARIVTGIKEDVNQFAGIGVHGDVIVQHKGGHVYFKFANFKMGDFNQKFEQIVEGEEFPVDYKDIPKTKMMEQVYYPFSATFKNGLVENFQVQSNDNVMSVNMKKAVLSAFQLDLEATQRKQLIGKSNVVRPGDKPSNKVFRVVEDGIGGDCDTVYEVYDAPHFTEDNTPALKVMKHRIYDNCNNRPYYFHSNRRGYKCETCPQEKDQKPFRQVSSTFYKIVGTRDDYTIKKLYHSSRYLLNPFSTYGKTILHGINMTMFLQEVKAIGTPITLTDAKTYDSLTYSFTHEEKDPEHQDLTHAHAYKRDFEHDHSDYKTKFDAYFNVMITDLTYTDDVKKHDITGKFSELIHLMETLSYDQLMELHKAHADYDPTSATPEQKFEKRIFYDLISNLGTGPAFLVIKNVIENKKVDNTLAEHLIASYPYYVKEPTEKLVEEFENLVKSLPHQPYSSLTSSSVMAVGHMINKALTTRPYWHHHTDKNNYMTHEVAKKHFKKVYELFNNAQTKWERLVYLATIQNIGLEESFPYIKDVIVDKEHKYSTLERIAAVYSLKKMVPKIREEILSVVTPIYRNFHLDYQLRIAAFNIIMMTKPNYPFMFAMGQALRFDHSQEVQSYVYSTFQSVANFSWPCAQSMREDARSVLELIPSYDYGYAYSKNLVFDFHDHKYNFGGFYQVAYTGAKDSIIPNSFHTKMTTNVMGYNFDHFEFGFKSEGLSSLKEKLFGPEGHFNANDPDKSVLNMFKRHPRNTNAVEKELQEIETAIKFKHQEEPKNKHFLMYFKALGQMVKLQYFDETIFNKFKTEDGLLPLPAQIPELLKNGFPVNFRKIGHMVDITAEIPNELGLPIVADLKVPILVSFKGHVKGHFEPGFFAEERNNKKPTTFKLDMDLSNIIDYQVIAKVGFTTPRLMNYGFGYTHEGLLKFPLRGDFEYNFHEKKYTGKMEPTKKEYDIFYMNTTPFTYMHDETKLTPLPEEKNIVEVKMIPEFITQEKTIMKDYFGVGLKFYRETDDHNTLFKGYYNYLHNFITKYGKFFENNEHGWSSTFIRKFVTAMLYSRVNRMYTPRMPNFERRITWIPDPSITEFVETLDFDYTPEYHKAVMPGQQLERDGDNLVYQFKYDLEAKGSTPRKYHFDITFYVENDFYTLKKLAWNYKRSALPGYDNEPFMACYNGQRKTPTDWMKLDSNQKSELEATLNFGKDCTSGAKIALKGIAEQSEEQKKIIQNKEKYPLYKKCESYRKQNFNFHWSCVKLMNFYHTPHHYVFDFKYENVNDKVKGYFHTFIDYLTHKLYSNLREHDHNANNEANHIRIETTINPLYPFTHYHIYMPHETLKFQYVYYPRYFPMLQKWNPFYSMKNAYLRAFLKHDAFPVCNVGGDMVSTFDHVEYTFPQTDCWQVMAKDATEQDRFTVLYKTQKHNTYHKAVKAFFGNHKVEILSPKENDPLIVRIDGTKADVKDNDEFLFWDPEHPNQVLFSVTKYVQSQTWYWISSPVHHMEIYYTGNDIGLKASQFHRDRVMGLCGTFNAEKHGDLMGPDHCEYKNPLNFAYSYAVSADGCKIPAHNSECNH
jgi:hypothetical protein